MDKIILKMERRPSLAALSAKARKLSLKIVNVRLDDIALAMCAARDGRRSVIDKIIIYTVTIDKVEVFIFEREKFYL